MSSGRRRQAGVPPSPPAHMRPKADSRLRATTLAKVNKKKKQTLDVSRGSTAMKSVHQIVQSESSNSGIPKRHPTSLEALAPAHPTNVSFSPPDEAHRILEFEGRPFLQARGEVREMLPLKCLEIRTSSNQPIYEYEGIRYSKDPTGEWHSLPREPTLSPMSDEDDEEVGIVAPSREIEVMLRSGGIDPMTLGDAIADGLLGSTPDSVEEQLLRFGRFYKECTLEGVWRLPDSPFRRLGLGVVAASIMRDSQLGALRARLAKTAAKVDEPPSLPPGSRFGLHNLASPGQPLPVEIMTPDEEGLNSVNLVAVIREAKIGRGVPPLIALYEALKRICMKVVPEDRRRLYTFPPSGKGAKSPLIRPSDNLIRSIKGLTSPSFNFPLEFVLSLCSAQFRQIIQGLDAGRADFTEELYALYTQYEDYVLFKLVDAFDYLRQLKDRVVTQRVSTSGSKVASSVPSALPLPDSTSEMPEEDPLRSPARSSHAKPGPSHPRSPGPSGTSTRADFLYVNRFSQASGGIGASTSQGMNWESDDFRLEDHFF